MDSRFLTLKRLQALLYYLFVLSIFLSWRINVGNLSTGKSVDVRIEDILFFIILILFSVNILTSNKKIKWTVSERTLFLWMIYKAFTTILSFAYTPLYAGRIFYLLKELEFILLILVFPSFANEIRKETIFKLITIGGIANGIYICWQLFTGNFMGLKHGYYGIAIVGEYSTLNSGLVLAFLSIFFLLKNERLLSILFTTSVVLTMSRASITALAAVTIIFSKLKDKLIYTLLILIIISSAIYTFQQQIECVIRIASINYTISSLQERAASDYLPIMDKISGWSLIFGLGKGLWGNIGLPIEAHNYYLRILLEEGILGFTIFAFWLYVIFRIKTDTIEVKLLKSTFLLILIASFWQDAMVNQKGLSILALSVNILQLRRNRRLIKC